MKKDEGIDPVLVAILVVELFIAFMLVIML